MNKYLGGLLPMIARKYRDKMEDEAGGAAPAANKAVKEYKRGGRVKPRGCGCAKRGLKKAKIY